MTNFEAWQFYMKDIPSPQSFIDFGFYFVLGTALQRRVWCMSENLNERSLFPNSFTVLVGSPALGKGLVIKPVCKLLRSIKLLKPLSTAQPTDEPTKEEMGDVLNMVAGKAPIKTTIDLEFAAAADSTTYQSLVREHANCCRMMLATNKDGKKFPYAYSSMYFSVEELGTLFREDQTDLMNYLQQCFDCSDEYTYKTKNMGTDVVKNSSLSLFGGTTYDFLKDAMASKMLGQGLTSRTLFLGEELPRFHRFGLGNLNDDQLTAWRQLVEHVRKLAKVFGPMTFSHEAWEYLKYEFEVLLPARMNDIPDTVKGYVERTNIHVSKLAMILTYSEHLDKTVIDLETVMRAKAILNAVEPKVQRSFSFMGANPRSRAIQKITKYMKGKTKVTPLAVIYDLVVNDVKSEVDLLDIMKFLVMTNKIVEIPIKQYLWKQTLKDSIDSPKKEPPTSNPETDS